jgi:hypothetical protein
MSEVLVATHQHVMTDVMILSGTINTKRRLVNVTLSPVTRFSYMMLSVILTVCMSAVGSPRPLIPLHAA